MSDLNRRVRWERIGFCIAYYVFALVMFVVYGIGPLLLGAAMTACTGLYRAADDWLEKNE